jgi:hypothetical protein
MPLRTLFGCIIYIIVGIKSACSIEKASDGLSHGTSRGLIPTFLFCSNYYYIKN